MSRCLVTFGVGPHADLLQIALPSFERFADRHGYELIVAEPVGIARPPSWWKVSVLQDALDTYDEALWVDADVVIVDDSDDLDVPSDAWQALVEHRTADGDVPNLGVWYLRQPMGWVLDEMWKLTDYMDHPWWEQAAMLELLGYDQLHRPVALDSPTELFTKTHWLETGWNVHVNDVYKTQRPRFMHATMHPDRAGVMAEWAAVGVASC